MKDHIHTDLYFKESYIQKINDGVHWLAPAVKVYCTTCGLCLREVELKETNDE